MGEKSKEIGEIGERKAKEFFNKIGWSEGRWGTDVACSFPVKHARKSKQHGLDGFYIEKSPFFKDPVCVYISVKCNEVGYPSGVSSLFKKYKRELEQSIDCAERDEQFVSLSPGIRKSKHSVGIIFWCTVEGHNELINKLVGLRLGDNIKAKDVVVIDDIRLDFIERSIDLSRSIESQTQSQLSFFYPSVDFNIDLENIDNSGNFLPVHMIHSDVLYFLRQESSGRKVLMAFVNENPDYDSLVSYVGSTLHWSQNLQSATEFYFSKFHELNMRKEIEGVLSHFSSKREDVQIKGF